MKRTGILSILMMTASLTAYSQNNIHSKVEVSREYEGKVVEAVKSKLDTRVSDTLMNFNLNFRYPTFYRPYKDLYEFSPQGTADLPDVGRPLYPWFLTRLSFAYPVMPEADVHVTPRFGKRFSTALYYGHRSFWGKLPLANTESRAYGDRMVNSAGAELAYRWKKGEVSAQVDYSGNYYSYRRISSIAWSHRELRDSSSHRFNRLRADLRARSTNADPYSFYYDVQAGYRYLDNREKGSIREHGIEADLSLGARIASEHTVFVKARNSSRIFRPQMRQPQVTTGLWEVVPTYLWERKRWRINVGIGISSTYSTDTRYDLKTKAFLYPDVSVNFEAVKNALWIYLKAYGGNEFCSQYDLSRLNPWFRNEIVNLVSAVPIAAELGLKGAVYDKFSCHLYGRYETVRGMLSFACDDAYQVPVLSDQQVVTAGADLKWQSSRFCAQADFKYRHFSDPEKALMRPAFDLDLSAEYNLRRRLFIAAGCRFRSSMRGMVGSGALTVPYRVQEVPGFVDLGVKVSYAVNSAVMVFLEGENLLNNRIQYFVNYYEPGTKVGVGMYLKF